MTVGFPSWAVPMFSNQRTPSPSSTGTRSTWMASSSPASRHCWAIFALATRTFLSPAATEASASAGHSVAHVLRAGRRHPERRPVDRGRHLDVAVAHPAEQLVDPIGRVGDETVQRHGHVGDDLAHLDLLRGGPFWAPPMLPAGAARNIGQVANPDAAPG